MKSIIKKSILTFLLGCSLSTIATASTNLSDIQKEKILIASEVGKSIYIDEDMNLELLLPAIMGRESSYGEFIVGDKYLKNGKLKSLYLSSLGPFQIKLSTAKSIINKNEFLNDKYGYMLYKGDSVYIKYEKNRKKINYYKSVLNNKIWKRRFNNREPKAISTIKWAKRELNKHSLIEKSLIYKASKDTLLINKLLNDVKFSAEVAGYYLKTQYLFAKTKKFSNVFKRSIGRYNGGWSNYNYAIEVLKNIKLIKRTIKGIDIR